MKKHFFLIPLIALLGSCSSKHYYQICKVSSELPTSSAGAYEYKGTSCDVTYDFWTEGGSVSFMVKNNTEDILYVDLSKSFLIKNGIAYDYFLNRTTSSTASIAASQNNGAVATALGYWNYFGKNIPGSVSATYSNSTSSQSSSSIAYAEKAIVAIPPFAAKIFSEYTILSNHYADCDLYESPSKKGSVSMSFNQATTPVAFTNYICYRVGDNSTDQFIENSFYISEVTNQHYDATLEKVDVGCPTDFHKTEKEVFIRTSPKEFFVIYSPRTQKHKKSRLQNKINTNILSKDDIY